MAGNESLVGDIEEAPCNLHESLKRFIQDNCRKNSKENAGVYMVPPTFPPEIQTQFPAVSDEGAGIDPIEIQNEDIHSKTHNEVQGCIMPHSTVPKRQKSIEEDKILGHLAEKIVYDYLESMQIQGVVFYGRCFASTDGTSQTFRENDFAILTEEGKICLLEVKCCSDDIGDIKGKRRWGIAQLKKLSGLLVEEFSTIPTERVGQVMVWPFLKKKTKTGEERFKDAKSSQAKHLFEEQCKDAATFKVELTKYLDLLPIFDTDIFKIIMKRFRALSCGVMIDALYGTLNDQLILFSSKQIEIVESKPTDSDNPLVIHGPPGSGKTLLIIYKIKQLLDNGYIGKDAKCLILTSINGFGVCHFLNKWISENKVKDCVSVKPFDPSSFEFTKWCESKEKEFTHIFVDSAEDFAGYTDIKKHVNQLATTRKSSSNGHFWLMIDECQFIFNLRFENQIPIDLRLSKTYRSTQKILKFIRTCFPVNPEIKTDISEEMSHNVEGPPVTFLNKDDFVSEEEAICKLIIDLRVKNFKAKDITLITFPIITAGGYDLNAVNKGLKTYYAGKENKLCPEGILAVKFVQEKESETYFCVSSPVTYKGLEAKVVILNACSSKQLTRGMIYTMATRCMCLLIVVGSKQAPADILKLESLQDYEFSADLEKLSTLNVFFQQQAQKKGEIERQMKHEDKRLQTFPGFYLDKEELSRNGLRYLPSVSDDRIRNVISCTFCGFITHHWLSHYDPKKEHATFCPQCTIFTRQKAGNIPSMPPK